MGNEFKIKKGFISEGDSKVNGVLSAQTINITTTPTLNTLATDILVRNNSTGVVEYRPVSGITGSTDVFVTGTTFTSNEAILTRNDSTDIFKLSGGTNVTLSNPSSNQIKIDVSLPPSSNTFVTGGTYSDSTNTITLNRNDAVTVDITGLTDSFVTAATLNVNTLELDRNEGLSTLSVDLLPVLSGKTNLTLFNTHTGDTANPHQTSFTNLTSTGHTHPITDVINLQTILDTKVEDGLNVGGANEIFSGKSGTTLIFRTISGGSNTTITQVGNVQKIDVTIPSGSNTFVTGGTYSDSTNILSLNRNDAVNVDITGLTDSFVTAATLNVNTLELDRNEGLSTLSVDLSNINTDTFVTGTTFTSNEATLTRNDSTDVFKLSGGTNVTLSNPSSNKIKIDVTIPGGSNTFVTGFTYDGANTLTIFDNVGSSFPATINTVTGLTVNGIISATTISGGTLYGDGSNLTGIASTPTTLRNITSTDTFSAVDETINCTSGTFIVNLPTAIGIQGTPYTLVNSGTGVITLKGALGQTINGSTTIDIKRQYVSRTVQSDGSNWIII